MTILLSLLAAGAFGAGDFAGGVSTRRARLIDVIALSHLIGLVGVFIVAVVGSGTFAVRDFSYGAIGGLFGLLGVMFLYRRLAVGPMVVVAPVTAITSAIVPAAWGLASGESFGALVALGLVLALAAIALVSIAPSDVDDGVGRGSGVTPAAPLAQVLGESLLAGVGFGAFFILMDLTDSAAAPWPVVGARTLTTTAMLLVLLVGLRESKPFRVADGGSFPVGMIALAGLFDCAGNTFFLYATTSGDLTTVSVLSSLYPAVTVLLARVVDREDMGPLQVVGFGLAVVATVLISVG